MADASFAAARAEISDGMAIEAMTPMMATTMSSSMQREAGHAAENWRSVESSVGVMIGSLARAVLSR